MAISGKLLLLRLNEALRARGSDGSAHDLFKLDENNKLQLLKLPQVASDASDANDLVRKSQVDFAVDGLDSRLDTAEGKLQVIEGDDQTAGSIAKAKKDSKDYVDQKIADLINSSPELLNTLQELAAAIDNDPQFAQTMAQQIGSLDGRLDTIEGDEFTSGSIAHAVKAERQRAELAEGALDSRLDTAESDINAIETQIASLGSNQAIVDLTNRVSAAEQDLVDIDGYNQDLRVDVDALEAAVAVLNGSSSVSGSVDQKVASAINAVIDGAPQAFDTLKEISDYISSDQSAGATMVSQIADHETRVASLESAMPSKASVSALSSEQSAREAADNALDARLDVVEALKKDVLTYESFTIDSSQLSAVTVQHAIKGMPFVIREGVMGRPGRDFTFSGAVITFAGEWVNPSGLSSVEVGTELDVAYMYETDAFSTSGGGGSGGGGGGGGGGGDGGGLEPIPGLNVSSIGFGRHNGSYGGFAHMYIGDTMDVSGGQTHLYIMPAGSGQLDMNWRVEISTLDGIKVVEFLLPAEAGGVNQDLSSWVPSNFSGTYSVNVRFEKTGYAPFYDASLAKTFIFQ
jgi:chromosome segregation ATPase